MSEGIDTEPVGPRRRVLWLSTVAFTLLFAVWLMLGMLSIRIKPELGLTDGQLYNLTIAAILSAGPTPRGSPMSYWRRRLPRSSILRIRSPRSMPRTRSRPMLIGSG